MSDIAAANTVLPGLTDRYNARFAKVSLRPDTLHWPLNFEPGLLREVLCRRDQRCVGPRLPPSGERKRVIFEENDAILGLVGTYVETCACPDCRPPGKQRTRETPMGRRSNGWNSATARIAMTKAAQAAGQDSGP